MLRETFILRKVTLTQDQWDLYLTPDRAAKAPDSDLGRTSSSTALLSRKSGGSLGRPSGAAGDGVVMSRKSSSFDVETGRSEYLPTRCGSTCRAHSCGMLVMHNRSHSGKRVCSVY